MKVMLNLKKPDNQNTYESIKFHKGALNPVLPELKSKISPNFHQK
jgi:hypothetical protein